MNIPEVYKAQPIDSFSNCRARMDSEVADLGRVFYALDYGSREGSEGVNIDKKIWGQKDEERQIREKEAALRG
jgi:hypothetical protein